MKNDEVAKSAEIQKKRERESEKMRKCVAGHTIICMYLAVAETTNATVACAWRWRSCGRRKRSQVTLGLALGPLFGARCPSGRTAGWLAGCRPFYRRVRSGPSHSLSHRRGERDGSQRHNRESEQERQRHTVPTQESLRFLLLILLLSLRAPER